MAWGREEKSQKCTTSWTEVPRGAGLMRSASFFSRLGTALRTWLAAASNG